MAKLVITDLVPDSDLSFILKGTIFDYNAKSAQITARLPKACPLMSKVKITYKVTIDNSESGADNAEFNFYKFYKLGTSGNRYKMRFYFTDKATKSQFVKNNKMKIKVPASGSPLSALNNQNCTIVGKGIPKNGEGSYVDFRINTAYQPTVSSDTVTESTHYFLRETKRKNIKKYIINIPKAEVFDQLINMKHRVNNPTWQVKDIPIYAYINYDTEVTSSDKLKLLNNDNNINHKTPPSYDDIDEFFVKSYSRSFEVGEKQNFAFYVAVARYTYQNGQWKGQWLQTNNKNEAIWSKAAKGG